MDRLPPLRASWIYALNIGPVAGYAVIDVDYGGSTGYGREYRNRLHQAWGIVDVEDCTNAAKFIVEKKKADPNRVAITGGSAGGYTTLCALVFGTFFKIGASYYGVSDLESIQRDTHKFEASYLDWLIGKYPEEKATYFARSPIHFTDQLSVPVIFLQGEEDSIVPPNQAEMMVNAIRRKGLPVEYLLFQRRTTWIPPSREYQTRSRCRTFLLLVTDGQKRT